MIAECGSLPALDTIYWVDNLNSIVHEDGDAEGR